MKIYIRRCNRGPGGWHDNEDRLRELWKSSRGNHTLVAEPADADFILITDLREDDHFAELRKNELVSQYPDKCFGIFEGDFPRPLLRGIYTSLTRQTPFLHRFRSGSYGLYHRDFTNPYLARHPGDAFDQEKKHLYCFAGRISHAVRSVILAADGLRDNAVLVDTSGFNLFTHEGVDGRAGEQQWFGEILEASKFSLCPRGAGTSSIRLFESMKIGIAPVIVADDWVFPQGPDWSACAVVIAEKDAARIGEILAGHEPRYREMGRAAQAAYQEHFSDAAYFDFLVAQCRDIAGSQRIPERHFWRLRHAVAGVRRLRGVARKALGRG